MTLKPLESLHQVKNSKRGVYYKACARTIEDGTGLGMVITMTVTNVNYVAKRCGTNMGWIVVRSTDKYVFLKDLDDGGKTITNDAEAVLKRMARTYPAHQVVYQDTDGLWWKIRQVYQPKCVDDSWWEVEFKPWHGEVWDILTRKD